MGKSINYIVKKLNKYLAIPSLSGKETVFLNHLRSDFSPHKGQEWFDVFHTNHQGQQLAYFSFLRDMTKPVDYIFVVHTDRVPDKSSNIEKPYTSSPLVGNDGTLKCQLDNAVSIAILRWLHHEGHSMNILFTTKEETCESWNQIRDVTHACWIGQDDAHSHWTHVGRPAVIVIDIDVIDNLDDFKDGKLTTSPDFANDRVLGQWFFGDIKGLPTFFDKANVSRVDSKHWRISELGFLHRFLKVDGDLRGGIYLGLPLVNYHTDEETTHISCIESMVAVLTEFLITVNR